MSRFGKQQLHELYYYLKLNRSLEEELVRLFRAGKLVGTLPISTGQEALGLGAAYTLEAGDFFSSAIPSNGALLARGVRPYEILSHFMAKETSATRGRDGSLQLGDLERGLVGPSGHLATHLGVMAGVGYAAKVQKKDSVALAMVSNRAVATGDFHEGLNFAAVHDVPLVVVVEKTPVGSRAPATHAPAGQHHYERLKAYGLPTVMVDGNDVLQVLQVVDAAVKRARSGKGPSVIEASVAGRSRFSMREDVFSLWNDAGDDADRQESALKDEELSDPVEQFEAFLIEHAQIQPGEQEVILSRVASVIAEDVARAEQEPASMVNGVTAAAAVTPVSDEVFHQTSTPVKGGSS